MGREAPMACLNSADEGREAAVPPRLSYRAEAEPHKLESAFPRVESHSEHEEFERHSGYISEGGDLLEAKMTLQEAKKKALELNGCRGFTFNGEADSDGRLYVYFKSKFDNADASGWTSYSFGAKEMVCKLSRSSSPGKLAADSFRHSFTQAA